MKEFNIISPIDQSIYATVPYHTDKQIEQTLKDSQTAQKIWRKTPLSERIRHLSHFCTALQANKDSIAQSITWQMGRPTHQAAGELSGVQERTEYMLKIVEQALSPKLIQVNGPLIRRIDFEPVGIVMNIAPWNYPLLTAINAIIPALLAGNAVILKHAPQTALCADILDKAFANCDLPQGLFQFLNMEHATCQKILQSGTIQALCFTGSVKAGLQLQATISNQCMLTNFELGGHDAAYVKSDAHIGFSAESLSDGAFFNAGQSCCGVKRIYVHENQYKNFLEAFIDETQKLKLGSPLDSTTSIGPVVSLQAAQKIQQQVQQACQQGAELVYGYDNPVNNLADNYLSPQILTQVNHSMDIMHQELFGPVVKIQSVKSDQEAMNLINDSQFGLTASIWSENLEDASTLGQDVEVGTLFINRCDYLDPALAWAGLKFSGTGCSLSELGFQNLTRPKSYHIRRRAHS
tara:strand:+ start:31634 stop:33025 length:1392 start_codon:yes stop_codon:yes gene_type:complete